MDLSIFLREWIHVAECGHYLSAQMNKSTVKISTVSILTIDKSLKVPKTNLSLKTLAEASGKISNFVIDDDFKKVIKS